MRRENGRLKDKEAELTDALITTKNALQEEQTTSKKLREELAYSSQQTDVLKEKNVLL
jgi:hypothetical protein